MTQMLLQVPIQYEVKKINRFQLDFPTELNIQSWAVCMVSYPKLKVNSVEIPYLNTSSYVAGRFTWSEFDIEFINPIGPSSSQKVMEWARLCAESATGRMGYGASYLKTLILTSLDPVGVGIEKWLMENCLVTNFDFGQGDYSDDGLIKIKLTVQPVRCIHSY